MKFRDLKKKKFIIHFDSFNVRGRQYGGTHYHAFICKDKGLFAHAEWENDNGLYTTTGTYPFQYTWKDLKHNLTHYHLRWQRDHRMPYHVYIYTGKCQKCGKPITFQEAIDHWNWCDECDTKLWQSYLEDEDMIDDF